MAKPAPERAAQYLRMSTERQDFSIELQMATNAAYALEHGYELVRAYSDEGVSGVGIERRDGLKRLIADVIAGDPGFSVIVVYDVSRWGRFQNPDQAAHYEFLCTEAGVRIEYSAETFGADRTPLTALLKAMKRAMAAEYSRELSAKTKRAQKGLRALGYWMGGPPGYGLRRQAVTRSGKILGVCGPGEWKGAVGARTVLVPGPPEEIAVVRRIYRMFTRDAATFRGVARALNSEGVPASGGRAWTNQAVADVLKNPKYIGLMASTRATAAIGHDAIVKPRSEWELNRTGYRPIISRALFQRVQRVLHERCGPMTDDELLADLQAIAARHGKISMALVDREARRSVNVYRVRFGTMLEAYRQAGIEPSPFQVSSAMGGNRSGCRSDGPDGIPLDDEEMIRRLKALLAREGRLTRGMIDRDRSLPKVDAYRHRFGGLLRAYQLAGYVPTDLQRRRSARMEPWRSGS